MMKFFKRQLGLMFCVVMLSAPVAVSAQIFAELCTEIDSQNLQVCDLALIDGYFGTLSSSSSGIGPSPLCPSGGIASNIMWFAFVAPLGDIQFSITPSDCMPGTTGFSGIQAGIYTDCTFDESIWCSQNCIETQFSTPYGLFTPGQVYYFFMSGCLGSVCQFQIDINETFTNYTMPLPDQITFTEDTCDPFPLCKGASMQLQVANFDTLQVDYEWFISIPDTSNLVINTEVGMLDYVFNLEGNYTVCFSATNGCQFVSTCEVFNVVQIEEEEFIPVSMCRGDFWLGPDDSEDINGDGLGWDGPFIIINDNDGVEDDFFIAENLAETPCGCLYLQSVEITVLDDSPTEIINLEVCDNAFPYVFDNMTFNGPVEDFLIDFAQGATNGCDSTILLTIAELPCQTTCDQIPPGSMNCDSLLVTPQVLLSDFPAIVSEGSELCIPIRVADFNYIAAMQFTVSFDPCVMSFLGANQVGTAFEGSNEILNTALSGQGNIAYLWFDSSGAGVCLEDNATLLELCFEFIGQPMEQAEIFISDYLVQSEAGYVANINSSICESTIESSPATVEIACDTLSLLQFICYKENSKSDVSLAACGGIPPYDIYLGGETRTTNANGVYTVFTDYLPTLYSVIITDAVGATATYPVTVTLDTPLEYIIVQDQPSCVNVFDGSLTVMQNDSTDFDIELNKLEWQNNQFNTQAITGIGAGTYMLTITDQYGCEYVESIALEAINSSNSIEEDSLCSGSGFSIVIGNDLYNESNPSGTTTLTSSSGCDSVVTVSLSFLETSVLINDMLCFDDQIIINGTVYDRNNPSGMEVIAGAATNNCDSIINVDLSFIDFNMNTFSTLACPGEIVTIMGVTLGPNNLSDTIFIENMTGVGCDTMNIFELQYHPDAIFNINGEFCEDDFIIVNGEIYDINNPTGVQTLINSSTMGCDSTIFIDLDFSEHTRVLIDTTLCFGEVLTLGGGIFVSPVENQIVTLEGADVNACDSIVDLSLNFYTEISINVLALDPDTGSGNGKIAIEIMGAVQPLNIVWSNGDQNTTEISNLTAGLYTVTITDANNCTIVQEFEVILMTDVLDIEKSNIYIYPNPFQNNLILDVRDVHNGIEVEIFTHQGQRVYKGNLLVGQNTLALTDLASGLYIYMLRLDNGDIIRGKLIKD